MKIVISPIKDVEELISTIDEKIKNFENQRFNELDEIHREVGSEISFRVETSSMHGIVYDFWNSKQSKFLENPLHSIPTHCNIEGYFKVSRHHENKIIMARSLEIYTLKFEESEKDVPNSDGYPMIGEKVIKELDSIIQLIAQVIIKRAQDIIYREASWRGASENWK